MLRRFMRAFVVIMLRKIMRAFVFPWPEFDKPKSGSIWLLGCRAIWLYGYRAIGLWGYRDVRLYGP